MLKTCNCCKSGWDDISSFLEDSATKLVGIQLNLELPQLGCLFLFDHVPCGSTLALKSELFRGMIEEPIPEEALYDNEVCSKYCLDLKNFLECRNECQNAPYRRLAIRIMQSHN